MKCMCDNEGYVCYSCLEEELELISEGYLDDYEGEDDEYSDWCRRLAEAKKIAR